MTSKSLTTTRILDELKKCGITHIVWLADSGFRPMYEAMMSQYGTAVIPVCREGEAIAIAVGLVLGGKNPVVVHQNTGFFEAGDSVRGLGLGFQLPLLLILGDRGWRRSKPVTDSAAIFIEPQLDVWGIKHYLVETDEDVEMISKGYKEAHETKRPVAILVSREYQ